MNLIIQIRFKELCGEDDLSALSLRDSVSSIPQSNEDDIVRYLKNAPNWSAVGKAVGDVLSGDKKTAIFIGTNTDGVYFWPLELAYYVAHYHVRLPNNFIQHMADRQWNPPDENSIDWEELTRALEQEHMSE